MAASQRRRFGARSRRAKPRYDWVVYSTAKGPVDSSVTYVNLVDDTIKSNADSNYPSVVTLVGGRIHVTLATIRTSPSAYRLGLAVAEVDVSELPTATLTMSDEGMQSHGYVFTDGGVVPQAATGGNSQVVQVVHNIRTKRLIPQNKALIWMDQMTAAGDYISVFLRLLVRVG